MPSSKSILHSVAEAQGSIQSLRNRLNAALVGKSDVVEMVIACVLARGHLLFDDLPGLGKTTLAKALAASIGGNFARIQCTPDLLPTDISGFNVFNQKSKSLSFDVVRSSQIFFWRMKSIELLPERKAHYLRPWPKDKLRSTITRCRWRRLSL